MVTLNVFQNRVTILEGYSEGTFAVKDIFSTPDFPYALNAADLAGNGNIDLALLSVNEDVFSIYSGDGNFSFF